MVLTSDRFAADHGLAPLATVRSWASVGVNPYDTGLAPTVAIPKALARAGLSVADVALWEINEAFAVVPVAACKVLDIDPTAGEHARGAGAAWATRSPPPAPAW